MEELQNEYLRHEVMGFMGGAAVARGKSYPIEAYRTMSLDDLRTSSSSGRGAQLVKFFPDEKESDGRNYSEEALRNQTVYLADPKSFNDPFDCVIGYDREKAIRSLLSKLATYFNIEINSREYLADCEREFAKRLTSLSANELPRLQKLENGASRLWYEIGYHYILVNAISRGLTTVDKDAVHAGLLGLVRGAETVTSNYCVSCFTSSVENGYMWAHYASGYRGFAIEYENNPSTLETSGFQDELAALLEANIWDVFYLLERPDCTDEVEQYTTCSTDSEWLARLYVKGLCTKHVSWGMESESRLILPANDSIVVNTKRNFPFYPARNVYLGIGMPVKRKLEIISLCRSLSNTPKVYDMTIGTSSFYPHFEEVNISAV